MYTAINQLEPQQLRSNFDKICSIPHPSKHEEQIKAFLVSKGNSLSLETLEDEVGNVIIRKPATAGFENKKTITLQSHMDMVPQKNSTTSHDFAEDPIIPYIDGEWVTAQDTTLGDDNGIGVAAILAVLESESISHGPLEALFTADEETGMTGAFNLKPGLLSGDILINLDSEDEGELYIGCAGGVNTVATFHYEQSETPENFHTYKLDMTGFRGGHSGVDIHLQRGNPNQEMARLLLTIINECDARICSFNGGSLRNAIPREAFALVAVNENHKTEFEAVINKFEKKVQAELSPNAPDLTLKATEYCKQLPAIDTLLMKSMLKAVVACPNGVLRMNTEMSDVVESSSNMGIVTTNDDTIEICTLQRASQDTLRTLAAERVRHAFENAGAQVNHSGEYPGWVPQPDSVVLSTMKAIYEQLYDTTPQIKVIHAGLECGIIHANYPHMEMISFGPTIRFPHSPDEKVHIESVEKFWNFLTETLKQVPNR